MSRIGKKAIALPKTVKIAESNGRLSVQGPRGKMELAINPNVSIRVDGENLLVERKSEAREVRAMHGLMRNLVANLVKGVTTGFERRLDIQGVGFKAEVGGGKLTMALGYSHPVVLDIPVGIEIAVDKATKIIVRGNDAQQVGQIAAVIRGFREPDIYKGKGIRYENEVIKLKAGKTGSK